MKNKLKHFYLYAIILLFALIFVSEILFFTIFETFCFPFRRSVIFLVWLVTCSFHYLVMKTVMGNPQAFNRMFVLQTILKFALYVACIAAFLNFFGQHALPFILHFCFRRDGRVYAAVRNYAIHQRGEPVFANSARLGL